MNPNPTPSISAVSPTVSNSACANSTGNSYSTPFVTGHSYSWAITGGTITSGASTNAVTVTWGSAGTGTLVVTETDNSVSPSCSAISTTYNVTINANPTPTVTNVSGTPAGTACAGVSGYQYSTPSIAGYTYSWTISGGTITSGSSSNQVTVQWGTGSTGTLSVTATNTNINPSCSGTSATYNVNLIAAPTPSISATGSTTANSACASSTNNTYNTPLVAGHTYAWTITGGTITSGASSNAVTVTWGSGTTGTLTVVEGTGGSPSCTSTSATYNVTLNPNPTPIISAISPTISNSSCANSTANNYSTPLVAGHSYSWAITGGTITSGAGTNAVSVTWGGTGAGTLVVTETDNSVTPSCASTSATYNVTINSNPTPIITNVGGTPANTACAGVGGYQYSTPLVSGYTYAWSITGGTITSGSTSNQVTVSWGSSSSGTLVVTATNTNTNPDCPGTSATYNVSLVGVTAPVISAVSPTPNNVACALSSGNTYSVPNVAGHLYTWSISGGTITSGNGTNQVVVSWNAGSTGVLNVIESLSGSPSCASAMSTYNVSLQELPQATIVSSNPDVNIACQSSQSNVYNVTLNPDYSYVWTVTGGTILGGTNTNEINVNWGNSPSGTVSLTITDNSTPLACSNTIVENVTLQALPNVSIPNPTIGMNQVEVCNSNSNYNYSSNFVATNTYLWTVNGGTIVSGQNTNSIAVQWTTVGTGTVIVTATNTSGSLTCSNSDTIFVNVNPVPTVAINATGGTAANQACQGSTANTYAVTANPDYSYAWTITGGTISSGAGTSEVSVTWGNGTSGQLSVVVIDNSSPAACQYASATYNVVLNTLPNATITNISSTGSNLCVNENYGYEVPAVAGNTYAWTVVGGNIISGQGTAEINVDWTTTGSGSVSVQILNTLTNCSNNNTLTQLINSVPSSIISIGLDTDACQNAATTYAIPNTLGIAYNWSAIGGTIVGSNTSNNVVVNWSLSDATGYLILEQTQISTGCTQTDTLSINVHSIPPTPSIIFDSPNVCENGIEVYTVTPISGVTYNWSATNGVIQTGQGTNTISVLWGNAIGGSISVTVTNVNDCTNSSVQNFTIYSTSTASISQSDGNNYICENIDDMVYTCNYSGTSSVVYNWTATNGTVTSGNGTSTVHVDWNDAASSGVLQLTVTDAGTGCVFEVNDFTVSILAIPNTNISPATLACIGIPNHYTATSISGIIYNWSAANGTISNGQGTANVDVVWGSAGSTGILYLAAENASTGCTSYDTLVLSTLVSPAPVIIKSSTATSCSSAPTIYQVQTPILGNTYEWSIIAGSGTVLGSSSSNTFTVEWSASENITIQLIESNPNGCSTSILFTETIAQSPVFSVSGAPFSCVSASETYSVSLSSGYTFDWNVTEGTINSGDGTNSIDVTWDNDATVGSVSLTVTNTSTSCQTSVNYPIYFVPNPFPNIVGDFYTCQNQIFEYSIADTTAPSNYTWSTSNGTIVSGNGTHTVQIIWDSIGLQTLYLTQEIYGSSCIGNDSILINVSPTPDPTFTVLDTTICQSTQLYIVDPSVYTNTITWNVTNGTILSGVNNDSVYINWDGFGFGTLTVTETNPASGCASSVVHNFVIVDVPNAIITGENSVCQNETEVYTAPYELGATYTWNITNGSIIGGNGYDTIVVHWDTDGLGTITVSQNSSSGGCSAFGLLDVNISSYPVPAVIGPDSVCAFDNTIYYSTFETPGHIYTWGIDNGTITSGMGTPSISVYWNGDPGLGFITLNDSSGLCSADIIYPIVVGVTPIFDVSIVGSTDSTATICAGDIITLDAGSGYDSYVWNTGDTTQSIQPDSTGTYSVTVENDGCSAASSNSIDINVLENPYRPILTATGFNALCSSDTLILYSNTNPTDLVTWSTGATNDTIYITSPGEYILNVLYDNGCTNSDTIMIGNSALSSDAGTDQIVSVGTEVQLNGSVSASNPYSTFWSPSTGLSDSSILNPTVTIDSTTTFYMTTIDSVGCTTVDSVIIYVQPDNYIGIPTAFTPDGDGLNDHFQVLLHPEAILKQCDVYNRWGEKVYTTNTTIMWDGKYKDLALTIGTYVYVIVLDVPGESNKIYKGDISILK